MVQNLEYYKVFCHVARCGSLTLAAKELSISQPAVSQSVRLLETAVGAKLFARSARGVKLTREGELLYAYVEKGYEQIELGERKLKQMMDLELGEIHIGASDMTLRFFLLPYLERFHELCPGIRIVVSNAPTPETLASLRNGKIDFGVVSTPFDAQGLECEPVREAEDIFVAGRRFIQYKNRMLDLKELERLPLILLEKNTSTRSCMDRFLAENRVEVAPEFELATSDMIVQFALRSLGVGNVVRDFAEKELEEGTLFELRFNKMLPKRRFCVVTVEGEQPSAAAKRMLELIRTKDLPERNGNDSYDYF
ncbi:MAG TPA: LysR family transcriptional regulator [Candidatus Eisenbergiella intestinipullorum]|nr:LysR family transcriptional regulator [Candidatus Eisenbergiella intestinipullorum]